MAFGDVTFAFSPATPYIVSPFTLTKANGYAYQRVALRFRPR
jgi:hypothetical protein